MLSTYLCDLHTHTHNSFDSMSIAEDMCRSAINRGFKAIAVTDHIEADLMYKKNYVTTLTNSYNDSSRCKRVFSEQLKVLRGIELGEAFYDPFVTDFILKRFDYDIIIGSIHNLRGQDDFSQLKYNEYSNEELINLINEYFYEEKLLAQWTEMNTLAHLTYPFRYIVGKYNINLSFEYFYKDIDEIFNLLIENNKALEINTSGLRQKINTTLPPVELIKRYYNCGGRLITIGSDSHIPEDVGKGISDTIPVLKEIGFKSILIFENQVASEIEL